MLCHLAKIYLIIGDTLYRCGVYLILRHCLNLEEAEFVMNDFQSGACHGHLSGLATAKYTISMVLVQEDDGP